MSIVCLLNDFKNGIKPEKHAHIYGRIGGSGKTQISYSLMKRCKELSIPFIYRTEFWKGDNGKYIEEDFNPENSAENVAQWILTQLPNHHCVILLDEVDIDLKQLQKLLKSKYSNKKVKIFIISF